jgi:putative xylitol transport system permease protein
MATAPLTKPEFARRPRRGSILQRYGTEVTLASILMVLCIFLTFATPVFLTSGNLSNLVKQSAINGIIALGMTVVIITGGIDLSVGSVVGLAGMIVGMLMTSGIAPWWA